MIGRRGFLQSIGAAVLGLSIALRGAQAQDITQHLEPAHPPEVTELAIWQVSEDNGTTWNDVPEGYPLKETDIVRWPKTHGHGWSTSTPPRRA